LEVQWCVILYIKLGFWREENRVVNGLGKPTKVEVLREMELSVIARNMEEVVLLVDDLKLLSGISRCRICHEEEFESTKTLEAPCACSGTVKVNPDFLNLLSVCFIFDNPLIFIIYFPVCS